MVKKFFVIPLIASGIVGIPLSTHAGWVRTYGEGQGYSVQQTTGGGYIVVGRGYPQTGFGDLWLIKTDPQGDILWSRTYGDTAELVTDAGCCVRQTIDGGYIIVGNRWTFGGYEEADGLWLIKTDYIGDTLWTHRYKGPYSPYAGVCGEQTTDGGYIITGAAAGDYENCTLLLLKTDSMGDALWLRRYGDSQFYEGYFVQQTTDGGYIVTGYKYSPSTRNDLWLLKMDASGDTLWTQTFGGPYGDKGTCVQQTSDGGYIVVGYTKVDPAIIGRIWLLKTDDTGEILWERIYDVWTVYNYSYHIQQTNDGGYIITGTVRPTPFTLEQIILVKTDPQGNELWTRFYGEEVGEDYGYCVQQTTDGGYIVTGHLKGRLCLIKTNANGDTAAVTEEAVVDAAADWEVVSSIGPQIILRYADHPQGFHASVFNAAGQKVGEMHSASPSGTITWGEGMSRGVYFIQEIKRGSGGRVSRVILLH
ncbi:hypothetical protein CEE36_10685 [candidate division TA06 bacterium B3_TA06]|uniref:Secretion system C-terminal sorting domain-containing protein n=1 Tax=candidate division TA06 bacterium B3_TA06 TaxID=2012487 RepID=A0A532UU45_UNCT6|nr:MAG: hypothetical protein CEE36_10685 [candidate division TA06 bacterium B3_TA06]